MMDGWAVILGGGDGKSTSADGTKQCYVIVENLVSEYHISGYGGYGGLAYHHGSGIISICLLMRHFNPLLVFGDAIIYY
ncbi:hypothetical protein [Bacillus thuringiensis]|uniref:hypothetical protein n=1 Tax=Bacillus thuringiensis TaxID=1428 RepID=UPI00386EF80B